MTILPFLVVLIVLAVWLWPIGLGGQMPAGGDITRFFLGLMAFLGDSYRHLRLPIWNDLWGLGFPGLAESQMGVYYPPHWLLYGLLHTTAAYTASLVLHTIWGAIGAYWAARRFGAGGWPAALAALAWSASGFFVIHLPHQWGYTVGSWMPWALGLAWPLARGGARPRDALLLAAVLAVQTLPGHFQLSFVTEMCVVVLAVWAIAERRRAALPGALALLAAVAAMPLLSAMQLLPTWELAKLAVADRDYDYLASFATPPPLLVSWVAPSLFHLSPLWRPLIWDPFHTSPEEHMPAIGLVPLFLALLALARSWRSEPSTRALGWLALVTLILSFGPYAPYFSWLIRLPGFSFFRAPARWSLATELALAILAARGLALALDRPRSLLMPALLFAVSVVISLTLWVAILETAFRAADPRSLDPKTLDSIEGAVAAVMPWDFPFRQGLYVTMTLTREPPYDFLVAQGLRRQGIDPTKARLFFDRHAIYLRELAPTALILAGLLLFVLLARRFPRTLVAALVGLTAAELGWIGHSLRPVDTEPLARLESASPVLAQIARAPRGTVLVSGLGNLPIAAGAATSNPYHTLDRPVSSPRETARAWLLESPYDSAELDARELSKDPKLSLQKIRDPALARWIFGGTGPTSPRDTFRLFRTSAPATRVWLLPADRESLRSLIAAGTLRDNDGLRGGRGPLPLTRLEPVVQSPEQFTVEVDATAPSTILLDILDDPEWTATWQGPEGSIPGQLRRESVWAPSPQPKPPRDLSQGDTLAIEVPHPGHWTLHMKYRGRAVTRGLTLSAVAWAAWLLAYWTIGRQRCRRPTVAEAEVR